MHCVKLLGQRLMARDFERHVAELQGGIAVMNVIPRSAYPSQRPQDKSVRGKGSLGRQQIWATEPHRAIIGSSDASKT